MAERYTAEHTPLPMEDGAGLSEEEKTQLDHIVQAAVRHICSQDPQKRMRHFVLMVLTLERIEEDGSHVVTSDTITSMKHEHMHETLRDWLRKETQ